MEITPGTFTALDFKMKLTDNQLSGVVVKADNRKAKRLLRNISENRDRNNPDAKPGYSCESYTRMELDLAHAEEHLTGKRFMREFGFVFDYMDTSVVSGVPYLPVMISETVSQRYHNADPELDREVVEANQVSGINKDNNLLTQFTGSLLLKNNFYKDFVQLFGIQFPSPIQSGGLMYYDYYIIDSLRIDGHKNYYVRYHPKKYSTSPAFDGEMYIDTESYALRSIHAKMLHGGNVNWLRDIAVDAEFQYNPSDSSWFFKTEKLYADFSVSLRDSSKMMSFIGIRTTEYEDPVWGPTDKAESEQGKVKVDADANYKDEAYWAEKRPFELTEKEKGVYEMVETIKDQPLYRDLYTTVYTLVTGYLDLGNIGFGPYIKMVGANNLEGFRPQLGIHTTKDFSKKFRWTVYGAYGFKDRKLKGGLMYEHMFRRDLTHKLTLDAHYDTYQLGRGNSKVTDQNIFSSLWPNRQKLTYMTSYRATYEHEFSPSLNTMAEIKLDRYFSDFYVPMIDWQGHDLGSIASNEIHLQARFSSEETVNRGWFIKTYVQTLKPIWTLDLTASVPGLRKGDVGFIRPELTLRWKFRLPPLGISRIVAHTGTIIGQVPYPYLYMFPGNGTALLDKTSFSCMDFMEYCADTWASISYDHNFMGFFLGKIPLLNKLQLREVFIFRAAWGTPSPRNDGTTPEGGSLMQFPAGLKDLGRPYAEIGCGVSNILRLVRVDAIWRLTDREHATRKFTLNIGLDFKF